MKHYIEDEKISGNMRGTVVKHYIEGETNLREHERNGFETLN